MNLLQRIEEALKSGETRVVAWFETILHHHEAGTTPPAPVAGTDKAAVLPPIPAPTQGTSTAPGITLVDATLGLYTIDSVTKMLAEKYGPNYPVQYFQAIPDLGKFDPKSMAAAMIEWNCVTAQTADQSPDHELLYVRVNRVIQNPTSALRPWQPAVPPQWVDNAWSIGAEYKDWAAVEKRALELYYPAVGAAHPASDAGFVAVPKTAAPVPNPDK